MKDSERESTDTWCRMGDCYYNGLVMKQDWKRAVEMYRKGASLGHSGARFGLGCCYQEGKGVEQDSVMALALYTKAAGQGHAIAEINMGLLRYHNAHLGSEDRLQTLIASLSPF